MTILYTGGTFDLFHSGHVNFLKRCDQLAGAAGQVIVSVNSDDFVERFKGLKPVMSLGERVEVLRSCRYVDQVVINEGAEDSRISILACSANYIAVGSDWARKDYYKQMNFNQDWLDSNSIGLIYIPYTADISTTVIRNRL